MAGVLDTTICDKVGQWLASDQSNHVGQWLASDQSNHATPVSSNNKTDRQGI